MCFAFAGQYKSRTSHCHFSLLILLNSNQINARTHLRWDFSYEFWFWFLLTLIHVTTESFVASVCRFFLYQFKSIQFLATAFNCLIRFMCTGKEKKKKTTNKKFIVKNRTKKAKRSSTANLLMIRIECMPSNKFNTQKN